MLKKYALATLLSGISFNCAANVLVGLNYLYFYEDDVNLDISGVGGTLGYQLDVTNNFSLIPEARFGISFNDDKVTGTFTNVEVDYYAALSFRGKYEINNEVILFVSTSYGIIEASASQNNPMNPKISIVDNEWELGYGGGLGLRFSPKLSLELSFEHYDDNGVGSLGLVFTF